MRANVLVSVIVAAGFTAAAIAPIAIAQNANPAAPAPARETPRPQDIDPAVNTSAPPARETPRPQDIEPRVNTSAPESRGSEAAPSAASSAATNAAAPGATPSSTPATASGARPSGATGATGATKGKSLDRLELDTTQITGNRELPKVLYIVPWKRSDLGDLVGKPINSLLDEVLTPVDRDVFQRENRYYRALTPGAAENDALSAPDGRPAGPVRNPVPTNSAPAAGSPGSATHPTNASAGGVSTGSGSAASPPRDEK
jgi:hypothetical protein